MNYVVAVQSQTKLIPFLAPPPSVKGRDQKRYFPSLSETLLFDISELRKDLHSDGYHSNSSMSGGSISTPFHPDGYFANGSVVKDLSLHLQYEKSTTTLQIVYSYFHCNNSFSWLKGKCFLGFTEQAILTAWMCIGILPDFLGFSFLLAFWFHCFYLPQHFGLVWVFLI